MKKGFTVIELLIVIAIVGILAAIIIPQVNGQKNKNVTYSPVGGAIETRCIDGYKFVVTKEGAKQILSEWGRGVLCK